MGFNFGRETGGSLYASKEQCIVRERAKQHKLALKTNRLRKRRDRETEIKMLQRKERKEKTQAMKEQGEYEVAKRKTREARSENRLINRLPGIRLPGMKVKKKKRSGAKNRMRIF